MKHTVVHLMQYLSIWTVYEVDSFSMCSYCNRNIIYGFGSVMVREEAKYPGNAALHPFRHLPFEKGASCISWVYPIFRDPPRCVNTHDSDL